MLDSAHNHTPSHGYSSHSQSHSTSVGFSSHSQDFTLNQCWTQLTVTHTATLHQCWIQLTFQHYSHNLRWTGHKLVLLQDRAHWFIRLSSTTKNMAKSVAQSKITRSQSQRLSTTKCSHHKDEWLLHANCSKALPFRHLCETSRFLQSETESQFLCKLCKSLLHHVVHETWYNLHLKQRSPMLIHTKGKTCITICIMCMHAYWSHSE